MFAELEKRQATVADHPLLAMLDTAAAVRRFMHYHVYAVWGYAVMLESLQQRLGGHGLHGHESMRLIEEIQAEEAGDLDIDGNPATHFETYLGAMGELRADTLPVRTFASRPNPATLPPALEAFVAYDLRLAHSGTDEELATAVLFGRGRLVTMMYERILRTLARDKTVLCPRFIYHLQLHTKPEDDQRVPQARRLLARLIQDDRSRLKRARAAGMRALALREALWDAAARAVQPSSRRGAAAAPGVSLIGGRGG